MHRFIKHIFPHPLPPSPLPSTPLPFDQNQAPTPFKPPPSPLRLFDYDRIHLVNKGISFHSCQLLSLRHGFIVSAHRMKNITLWTLIATPYLHGEWPTYILNEETQPVIRAIEVLHTDCKDEFGQNLGSHSWSVILFFILYPVSRITGEGRAEF